MKKILYTLAPCFLILFSLFPSKTWSQEQFIGEIKMFAGFRVPNGWAKCEGQILPIAQFSALFSLLGMNYGGNGTTNFALPDLRGNVPVGLGQASNQNVETATIYRPGTKTGTESLTLTANNLPAHYHSFNIYSGSGNTDIATGAVLAIAQSLDLNNVVFPFSTQAPNATLKQNTLSGTESNLPINNQQPTLIVSYIIALEGYYPSRW